MPYSSIVQSSMCRARETANVISGHLPNVPLHTCDLLQEGAPFPPEPPVGHWKPEMHVNYTSFILSNVCSVIQTGPPTISSFIEMERV
jgi:hypothetical protein